MILRAKVFALLICLLPWGISNATIPTHDIPTDFAENHPELDSISILVADLMNDFPKLTDEEYKQRLQALSGIIQYRLDPLVKSRIEIRTEKYRASTEKLLGKSDIYFPIFEEHLAKYNIPHHLKYLAIIESHLNPVAKSVASAVGLWQFIPSSGRLFGLKINSYVDERSDTYKASEAAAKLLSMLYDKYGDWALSMAAYNCGPGRVDQAIKRAGGAKDYWTVRKYLPRETQKYVPYFMAMVYVGEYHTHHELKPVTMPQSLVLTDTIHMDGGIALRDLAEELNMSMDTLKFLNPSYRRNYIPKSKKGQIIVLPASIVSQLRGYQNAFNRVIALQKENPIRAVRRIRNMGDLQFLAKAYRCRIEDLLFWNDLPIDYQPYPGDLIAIRKYAAPKDAFKKKYRKIESISIPSLRVVGLDESNKVKTSTVYLKVKPNKTIASAPNSTLRMKAMARREVATSSTPQASVPGAKHGGTTRIAAVSNSDLESRDRGRRFRNYGFVSAEKEEEKAPQVGYSIESSYTEGEAKMVEPNPLHEKEIVSNGEALVPMEMMEEARKMPKARDLVIEGQKTSDLQAPTNTEQKEVEVAKSSATTLPQVTTTEKKAAFLNSKEPAQPAANTDKTLELPTRTRDRNLRHQNKTATAVKIVATQKPSKDLQPAATTQQPKEQSSTQAPKSEHPLTQIYQYHKVQNGETLWSIQAKYPEISVQELVEENQLKATQPLRVGQLLKLRMQ